MKIWFVPAWICLFSFPCMASDFLQQARDDYAAGRQDALADAKRDARKYIARGSSLSPNTLDELRREIDYIAAHGRVRMEKVDDPIIRRLRSAYRKDLARVERNYIRALGNLMRRSGDSIGEAESRNILREIAEVKRRRAEADSAELKHQVIGGWTAKVSRQVFTWRFGADGTWVQTFGNQKWKGRWDIEGGRVVMRSSGESIVHCKMVSKISSSGWKGTYQNQWGKSYPVRAKKLR